MTSIRRIYIDSRQRTSGSDSDFTYDLPRSIEVPDHTIAFVDSVLLPNVFTSLHENNNRLYVSEQVGPTMTEHTYLLQEGNYTGQTLASLLATTLNGPTKTLPTDYTVAYDENIGKLTISNVSPDFIIFTREALVGNHWNGSAPLTLQDVRDCNDVIGNMSGSTQTIAGVHQMGGFIDLIPYKNLFLCSSTFGNLGQVLGPVGQGDIIRRVAVTAPFGNLIYDAHSTSADYIDCSLTQISQMRWRITDERGRAVSLKNHGVSFSICFMEKSIV